MNNTGLQKPFLELRPKTTTIAFNTHKTTNVNPNPMCRKSKVSTIPIRPIEDIENIKFQKIYKKQNTDAIQTENILAYISYFVNEELPFMNKILMERYIEDLTDEEKRLRKYVTKFYDSILHWKNIPHPANDRKYREWLSQNDDLEYSPKKLETVSPTPSNCTNPIVQRVLDDKNNLITNENRFNITKRDDHNFDLDDPLIPEDDHIWYATRFHNQAIDSLNELSITRRTIPTFVQTYNNDVSTIATNTELDVENEVHQRPPRTTINEDLKNHVESLQINRKNFPINETYTFEEKNDLLDSYRGYLTKLREEENNILQKKTTIELEKTRGPKPYWYTSRSTEFHEEMKKSLRPKQLKKAIGKYRSSIKKPWNG
eukprot:TRINITY_DN2171_c0_g1_i1.p1 TRINITY_DN2171_c0_g1~~TRINITY_DN2171_c0_g1_i1.p1  ORF type:complete len:382 (-),score=87.64 TRINITY_DN2171_c0_g1_i1:43-1161(-)